MLPNDLKKNQTRTIIVACITLVIGVLFCCSLTFADGLSWLIGGSLCFTGILCVINSIIQAKSLLTLDGILGAVSTAFGIMFIIKQLAQVLLDFVPYLMIAIGLIMIVEAFLARFARYNSLAVFIIALVVGTSFTALGFCLMFIKSWARVAALIFGVILIVVSLYALITTVLAKKNARNERRPSDHPMLK